MTKQQHFRQPPRWIGKWLERYTDDFLAEGIKGDLLEIFEQECDSIGYKKARRRYLLRAVGFFRPAFKKKKKTNHFNSSTMWKNHFVTSFRSLVRHKQYFAINTFGLVVALSCALLATVFALDELSFDKQHAHLNHIYRLYKTYRNPEAGTSFFTAETSGMMGPTMVEEYPEVDGFMRLRPWWDDVIVSKDEKHIAVKHFVFADSSFFSFFDFQLVAGNPATALKEPSSIVLSESLAASLFGNANPIGQTVEGIQNTPLMVTGVVADAPRNSHIQYDALVSWATTVPNVGPLSYTFLNNWLAQAHYTYLRMAPGADPKVLEDKLPAMISKYLPERADQYFLHLQPLSDVYLSSHEILSSQGLKMGSMRFLKIFLFTGLLVLLIASFNYINISLAKLSKNIKEVAVRKVLGSGNRLIIERFVAETLLQVAVALVISFLTVAVLLSGFNELSGKDVPAHMLTDWRILAGALTFTLVVGLLIGIYPSLVLTSGSPSGLLKSSVNGLRVGVVRKLLLVAQYAISTALIAGTWIVFTQTRHLISQTENVSGNQVIVINVNNEVGEKSEAFINTIKSHPNVVSITHSRSAIGSGSYGTTLFPEGGTGIFNSRMLGIDHTFFETYDIDLLEGEKFRPGFATDSASLMVNKTFVDKMGWETGIGKKVKFNETDTVSYPIMGVVEDFHTQSPAQYKMEPAVMFLSSGNRNNISIKAGAADMAATVAFLEDTWNNFADRTPFAYYFVNEWYERQFQSEIQMLNAATIFALLSILLCGLGLYGLTALLLEQRMKELSVRKVLGAGPASLVLLINRQFAPLVAIAFCVAVPVSWAFGKQWLEPFAYQASITAVPFVVAGCITFAISAITISLLTFRSSRVNPASVLKNE